MFLALAKLSLIDQMETACKCVHTADGRQY